MIHFVNPSIGEWTITVIAFVAGYWCGVTFVRWVLRRKMAKAKK
jgi:hypothetical protein